MAKKTKEKKKAKNKTPSKRYSKYKVEEGKLVRAKSCPKCGAGTFLANHKNRYYCGKCHYVEIKK
ncbi:30S ribosomal protein S27ae [Candidatus Woesearchaeota archaeon]|nr:30S ribosomal protein S27ae [Candidatus Woesearchaeota archaeon]